MSSKKRRGEGSSTATNDQPNGFLSDQRVAQSDTYSNGQIDIIPVYCHDAEIEYNREIHEDNNVRFADEYEALRLGWRKEEDELINLLHKTFGSISEPETLDLGAIHLNEYHDRLFGVSAIMEQRVEKYYHYPNAKWLLLLPTLQERLDSDAFDLVKNVDILSACRTLEAVGKTHVKAHLFMTALPTGAGSGNEQDFAFRLHLKVEVALKFPNIFEPFAAQQIRRKLVELEDAQRHLLSFLYPSGAKSFTDNQAEADIPLLYSILGPAPMMPSRLAEKAMQPPKLLPTLLPFQRRSVGWMLHREGKTVNQAGEHVVRPPNDESDSQWPLFWERVQEANKTWYLHRLTGVCSLSLPPEHTSQGGILAEEPGLGKTLECIALILLNPSLHRNPNIKRWDEQARISVSEIKTTLIVTPPTLASQWADELALHAPSLKVLIYEGWRKIPTSLQPKRKATAKTSSKTKAKAKTSKTKTKTKPKRRSSDSDDNMDVVDEPESFDWCTAFNSYDVCITTYSVLRLDLSVARAVPVRPRREDVVYSNVESRRSPLIMCEWARVIMDEVQMVGGGKVEDMVSLIPRISSFAVSGTPARSQVSDLIHILKFLRVDDQIGSLRLWNRLLKPGYANEFAAFFREYAIRTMKSAVKAELTIPQQTRFLVGIELGRVERHVYDEHLEAALLELGLDARGVAASNGWEVDTTVLRSTLRRLRGICTHPQVGQLQKQGDNLYKPGVLKGMSEVLETMSDQNWRNSLDDRRSKVQVLVRRAQLQQHDQGNLNRYQHSLDALLLAEQEANQYIDEVNTALAEHDAKGEKLKKYRTHIKAVANGPSIEDDETHEDETIEVENGKGKEKAREEDPEHAPAELDDSVDDKLPRNPVGEEHVMKKRGLQQRLREGHVLLHRAKFLQGDVYHVLGKSYSPAEDAAYAAAEEIRRNLLKNTEDNALRAMTQLAIEAKSNNINKKALMITVPYCEQGGIKSEHLMEEADKIISDLLNEQSKLLWKWRMHIFSLLTQKLSDTGDEADGQEYSRSLDIQGEAETYLQAYTALLADRREVLVAERTLLAAHDTREKKLRKTKAAIKAAAVAAAALQGELQIPEDVDFQPEHEVLHKELSEERKELLAQFQGRAIKSVMIDLTAVAAATYKKDDPERLIALEGVQQLRQLVRSQGALMDKLDADLALFRKAFNDRILYFRQLQEISDSVAEVEWEEASVTDALAACALEETDLDAKINTGRARQRYLEHLARSQEDGDLDEDDEACILCRCEFVRGFITQCAHIFCEGCLQAWLLRKEGKACPVCRVLIDVDQMQRFTLKGKDNEPPVKPVNDEPAPRSSRSITYNKIDPHLFESIQNMESDGSYGSKIQTLVRHLLYIKATEPEAKSVVFSAWADSLIIIQHALSHNGVPCLRIDQSSKGNPASKRFRTDPNLLVLLLHGERENAGLNVTCASRVFLVESVVNQGFEVQAIARIDRMGQSRPTEVYCYYAEDTVERNILDLAARRGVSLYELDHSTGTLDVTALASESQSHDSPKKKAAVQKGDFIFNTDDMLAILFPHMFEDVEYLLPAEEDADNRMDTSLAKPSGSRTRRPAITANAVAGPSRLA